MLRPGVNEGPKSRMNVHTPHTLFFLLFCKFLLNEISGNVSNVRLVYLKGSDTVQEQGSFFLLSSSLWMEAVDYNSLECVF